MTCSLKTGMIAIALLAGVAIAADESGLKSIYQGPEDAAHWIGTNKKPIPATNATAKGINPHGSGSYVVVYEKPLKDFVLDFDYQLTEGCNSGVFLRVGDLKNPVMSGLEIAIDDTKGTGFHDPGAFYDLVKPKTNAQKPAGEWNHMTITAKGPKITIVLNGQEVSTLDHDAWPLPGKRPDGSNHKFTKVAIKDLNQKGYVGFQDHGKDCWFKNVKLKSLDS